ncbi:MAG: aminotransferase class I/II-fold pyridoxal phosphate-dependent enzyme [Actinomycetota bacterium]|nr:aminotransferase class I/II-fold pyridoxal phosphate-dependent enzyme [Actinomycetota bacterium]
MTAVIPPPGLHGGDGARLAAALGVDPGAIVDLSASFNPAAPDVGQVVAKHLDTLSSYPDPGPASAALAAALEVDVDRLLLTNGGAEAIALVAAELGGRVDEPDFALYPRGTGPLWRSNPHNPSGRLAGPTASAQVWDEAFYPLATGRWTRGDADNGAVVLGSLTKVFACPGLRVGYVVAPDTELARRLTRRQTTWSVNSLAAAAVPDLMEVADLAGWSAIVAAGRAELRAALGSFGLEAGSSDAPWLIVRAPGLRARLAPHGVLVRDCASFGLPDHVRIAVPDPAGLCRLVDALAASSR